MTTTIEVGHQCPHCKKGIVLELDVEIQHVTGRVRKPDAKKVKSFNVDQPGRQ